MNILHIWNKCLWLYCDKCIHLLVYFSDGANATQSYNCTNAAFLYHGYRTTGMTVYDMFFPVNEWECHDSCRDDNTCLGYTYREDYMICSLSHDTIYIDASPCNLCRFFEKTCHSCMYKTIKESIKKCVILQHKDKIRFILYDLIFPHHKQKKITLTDAKFNSYVKQNIAYCTGFVIWCVQVKFITYAGFLSQSFMVYDQN